MTGFAPHRDVEIIIEQRPHTKREWYGCPDCWAKIKPGPPARLTVDEHPTAADTTTTGGV